MSSVTTLYASGTNEQGQVSATFLRAVAGVAQQHGISPEKLFGADAATFYAEPVERWLPLARLEALFERAIELTNDPALGLRSAIEANQSSYGVVATLVSHAATLRAGLELVEQFQRILMEGTCIRLTQNEEAAEVRFEFSHAVPSRSVVEFLVAGLVRNLRSFGCTRADIRTVCFKHARPAHHEAYSAAFCGAERFGQRFIGVVFSAQALDRPHLDRHSELHKLALDQAEHKLTQLWKPRSCTERLAALMNGKLPKDLPSMAAAARQLGLSERSLRRRLVEEGTSFRDLTQSAMRHTARELLRNPNLTVTQIAKKLDFGDASSFYRAFRRWNGCTIAEYRTTFLANGASARKRA